MSIDDPATNSATSDAGSEFEAPSIKQSSAPPDAPLEVRPFPDLPLRQWPSFGEQGAPDREFDKNAPTILEIADEFFGDVPEADWEELPLYDPHQAEEDSSTTA